MKSRCREAGIGLGRFAGAGGPAAVAASGPMTSRRPALEGGLARAVHLAWTVVAAVALACPAPARARELLVISTHFEKVYERDAEGMMVGLGPEIVRHVARQLGHTVRFELYPWARAQALVANGQADILVAPYRTPARQQVMGFSRQPFFRDNVVFYARTDDMPPWRGDYRALAAQRVAVLNGWAYGEAFERARPGLRLSVTNSVESGLRMLAHRHVNLFASNRRDTDSMLARLGLSGQVASLPVPIDSQDAYFAFPLGGRHDALRRDFDEQFQRLVDSGEWRRLLRRHEVDMP